MKKFEIFFVLLLMISLGAGDVYHDIEADSEDVEMNTTVELECEDDCPVSSWSLTWTVPEDSEVLNVTAEKGGVMDWERSGQNVRVTTEIAVPSDSEKIGIRLRLDRSADEIHDGLYRRQFSLPSFEDVNTSGEVRVENLSSGRISYGFETAYTNDTMQFQGQGPAILRIKFGDGEDTRYFEYFGESRGALIEAYEIPLGMTGLQQEFDRFPVAVLPDKKYNETLNQWSAGEYFNGVIRLRQSLDEDFKPVLAHEVVHGLNDRALNWDETGSSYFEEGSSRFVDHLVRQKMYREEETEKPPRELFGDSVRYDTEPGDGYYRQLPPRGDREQLWRYYQEEMDFMKDWTPSEAPEEQRGFGYAYSELMVRYYVMNNNSLSEIYGEVDPGKEIESVEEKWGEFSEVMETRPCDYEDRERFDQCLDRVEDHDYQVYSAEPVEKSSNLDVRKVEMPEKTEENVTETLSTVETGAQNIFQRFFDSILGALQGLIGG